MQKAAMDDFLRFWTWYRPLRSVAPSGRYVRRVRRRMLAHGAAVRNDGRFVERDVVHDDEKGTGRIIHAGDNEKVRSVDAPFALRGSKRSTRSDRWNDEDASPRPFSVQTEETIAPGGMSGTAYLAGTEYGAPTATKRSRAPCQTEPRV